MAILNHALQNDYSEQMRYLIIKLATEQFKLNPQYLDAQQYQQVQTQAQRLQSLQQKIIASAEAQQVTVAIESLSQAEQNCINQFDDISEFESTLSSQGLTHQGLRQALYTDLLCEQVLAFVSRDIPPLEQQQARDFYNKNRLQFARERSWYVRQILITINDAYPENTRTNAWARINEVAQVINVDNFAELALRYSECPSALENGDLGWCEEGKLYPEIRNAMYHLACNEISAPLETEVGFHLVLWQQEKPAMTASFEQALPYLEQRHAERARAYLQKIWLNQLQAATKPPAL